MNDNKTEEELIKIRKEIMNVASRYFPFNTEDFEDLEGKIDEQIAICMKKGGMKSVKNYRDYVRKGFAIFRNEFNKAVKNEVDKLLEEKFVAEKARKDEEEGGSFYRKKKFKPELEK